jgi:hypothetical protein
MKPFLTPNALELSVSGRAPAKVRCRLGAPQFATFVGLEGLQVALLAIAAILEGNGVDPAKVIADSKHRAPARIE